MVTTAGNKNSETDANRKQNHLESGESEKVGKMASVVKNALQAIRERGIGNFLRELREEG